MPRKRRGRPNKEEMKRIRQLDGMAEFEQFEEAILPALKKDLYESKLSAEEIYEKYCRLAAARTISIAATERDSAKAMAAIRDIMDRTKGKATEKREVTHRMAKLSDEELEALVMTEEQELLEADDEGKDEDYGD